MSTPRPNPIRNALRIARLPLGRKQREILLAWFLILPSLAVLGLVVFAPIAQGIYFSLLDYTLRTRANLASVPVYLTLGLFLAVLLFPVYWMLAASFQPNSELIKSPPNLLPQIVQAENYTRILTTPRYLTYFKNSIIVSSATVALSFIGEFEYNWAGMMALSVAASLPMIAIFIFLQRYMISGLTQGAVKG
jgi:ABC-type glycerol-3-phosphate transport system permease component